MRNEVHVLHGNGAHEIARAMPTAVTCQAYIWHASQKLTQNSGVSCVSVYRLWFNKQRETKIASNVLHVVDVSLLENPEPIDCDFHRND